MSSVHDETSIRTSRPGLTQANGSRSLVRPLERHGHQRIIVPYVVLLLLTFLTDPLLWRSREVRGQPQNVNCVPLLKQLCLSTVNLWVWTHSISTALTQIIISIYIYIIFQKSVCLRVRWMWLVGIDCLCTCASGHGHDVHNLAGVQVWYWRVVDPLLHIK